MEVGKIYNLEVKFKNRDNKYAICVCVSTTEFLLINSKNDPRYDCIPLKKNGRRFPDYNSFISCSNTIARSEDNIIAAVGELTEQEARVLRDKIMSSESLEQRQIDRIVASLQEYIDGVWDG